MGMVAVLVLGTGLGSTASAQRPGDAAVFSLGLYGGGSSISDLQRRDVYRADVAGGPLRRIEQTVAAEPAVLGGAVATVWPSRHWGVRAHVAYGTTEVSFLYGPDDTDPSWGSEGAGFDVWLYDLAVVLRAPAVGSGGVVPYAVLGAGAVRYRLARGDGPGAPSGLFGGASERMRVAGLAGVGVDVPLHRHGLSLAFEFVDHFTRTPVEVGSWTSAPEGGGEGGEPTATHEITIVNQIRFSAGLALSLR